MTFLSQSLRNSYQHTPILFMICIHLYWIQGSPNPSRIKLMPVIWLNPKPPNWRKDAKYREVVLHFKIYDQKIFEGRQLDALHCNKRLNFLCSEWKLHMALRFFSHKKQNTVLVLPHRYLQVHVGSSYRYSSHPWDLFMQYLSLKITIIANTTWRSD